jgi:CMP-N,N'-diacetyllegionaminic acid synthase
MKILCVIPARGGSKGIERKNIRKINNKPLIAYTIESTLSSKLFDDVIVSTDDSEIAEISKSYGAKVPFIRPSELAQDNATSDQAILHAVVEMKKLGFEYDVVVLRDCTVPFIDINDMKNMLELFKESNCNAVFGAIKAHPSPYFGMMECNDNGFLIPSKTLEKETTRRQDAPVVYDIDGIFILDNKNFLKTKKIFSGEILPYEISKEHGHMIDFEFDFKVAELLLKNN